MRRRDFLKSALAAVPLSSGQWLLPSMNPQIDWSNPLAYGLTGAYLPGRGGKTLYDLTGFGAEPICGTSFALKATQEGQALDTSAQGSGQGCNAVASAAQQPTKTASLFWRGILLGAPAGNEYLFGVEFQDGSTSPFDAYDLTYLAAGTLQGGVGTVAGGTFGTTWSAPTNTIIDAALAVDLTGVSPAGTGVLYGNGVKIGDAGPGTGSTIDYGTNPQLQISSTSSQTAANARHLVGFTWSRALQAAEVLSLHLRPYQLFIWPEDRIGLP